MNRITLLRQRNSLHYYSDILDDTHCVYGFLHRDTASQCREFLIRYKIKHKRYPFIGQKGVKYVGAEDSVILEDNILEEMKTKCILNGVHLIGIHTFEYEFNSEEVRLSGAILTEGEQVPQEFIRNNLEYILEY